jgi:hypothetical protein
MTKAAIVVGVNKTGDLPVLKDAAAGAGRVAEWLASEGYFSTKKRQAFERPFGPMTSSPLWRRLSSLEPANSS